jgi:rifampicin phosphotransferase
MMTLLDDKVVVISGGGQGLGLAAIPLSHCTFGGIAVIERSVLGLHEVDETQVAVVGGKGAHLGGLSRI